MIELKISKENSNIHLIYPFYFHKNYSKVHDFQKLILCEGIINGSTCIFILFDIQGGSAISLPFSPFGSFWTIEDVKKHDFEEWWRKLVHSMIIMGVDTISIDCPPSIYSNTIPESWLIQIGMSIFYTESNQIVNLEEELKYHEMELRKLKKLQADEQIKIEKLNFSDYQSLHTFVSEARTEKNLIINITWEKLKKLVSEFPDNYEAWVAIRDKKWLSVALMVKITPKICYYYLAATPIRFLKESPMVLLVDHIISHYKKKGYKFLDLGISSVRGVKQKGLYDFKKRMGAQTFAKNLFTGKIN